MTTRLARLQSIRGIARDAGLRTLATAQQRAIAASATRDRLEDLVGGLPVPQATTEFKAVASTRAALQAAALRLDAHGAQLRGERDTAGTAAARLQARLDVVDAALIGARR